LLGPAQIWGQLQANAAIKDDFRLEFAHRVKPTASQMAVDVIPANQQSPGTHCVIQVLRPAPRYTLVSNWEFVELDQQPQRMSAPEFKPLERIVVDPSYRDLLGESSDAPRQDTVQVVDYRAAKMRLKVSSERTAVLRCADKFDPNWTATVNGKPAEVIRCDYLFRGVKVPPGLHDVELVYKPSRSPIFLQCMGLALTLGALGMCLVQSKQPSAVDNE